MAPAQARTAGVARALKSPFSGATPSGSRPRRSNAWRAARILVSAALLIGAWWLGSRLYASFILPGPPDVWRSFTDAWSRGAWWQDVSATLVHMFIAMAIILGAGLPIGIVIGRSVIAEDLTRVWLVFLQTVPTIVIIAIALIFIGSNTSSVIAVTV